jgi:hypothetical protein
LKYRISCDNAARYLRESDVASIRKRKLCI